MKESLWGYWIVVLGLFIIVVMMLLQNYTTTNQQDYYLLKEVADASMTDAIDLAHFRAYGEVRIVKEKFVENFVRRFSETVNINKKYELEFRYITEAPPSAGIQIITATDTVAIAGDIASVGVVNRLDAVVEILDDSSIGKLGEPCVMSDWRAAR